MLPDSVRSLRLAATLLVAGLLACGDAPPEPPDADGESSANDAGTGGAGRSTEPLSPVPAGADDAGAGDPTSYQLVDESVARGVTGLNHCGDAETKRYLLESIGCGAAFLDYDLDGAMDLYVVDGCTLTPPAEGEQAWTPAMDGKSSLYRNDGSGHFSDVTDASGAGFHGLGCGIAVADADGDGAPDFALTAWGPNKLFRNRRLDDGFESSQPSFEDVSAASGVDDPRWGTGLAWFDADRDGDVDLYVANYFSMNLERDPDCWRKVDCDFHDMTAACGPKGMIADPDLFYRNRGDGTFEEVSAEVGFATDEARYGLGVVAFDQNLDGDVDLYVANDSRGNFFFEHVGEGRYEEVADFYGASLSREGLPQAGMGIACGDSDGDGDSDLFLTNFSHDYNTLYRNEGMEFLDVTKRSGFGQDVYFSLGWGAEFVDLDLDGTLELLVANGHIYPEADARAPELTYAQLNRVYQRRQGIMADRTLQAGPGMQKRSSSRGLAVGDIDNDRDLDLLFVEQNAPPTLLVNHLTSNAHALVVSLVGTESPRDGLGARVVAEVGGRTLTRERRSGQSFVSSHDPRLVFGLREAETVARLTVHWPSGAVQTFESVPGDQWIELTEGADSWTTRE